MADRAHTALQVQITPVYLLKPYDGIWPNERRTALKHGETMRKPGLGDETMSSSVARLVLWIDEVRIF